MIIIVPDPPFLLPSPLFEIVQQLVWPLFYYTGIIASAESIFCLLVFPLVLNILSQLVALLYLDAYGSSSGRAHRLCNWVAGVAAGVGVCHISLLLLLSLLHGFAWIRHPMSQIHFLMQSF